VLFCSLLESAGTETGFNTVPGHIDAAFNTKVAGRDFARLHPEREMTIDLEEQLWVPVEITFVGKTSFVDAWCKGKEEWAAYNDNPKKRRFFPTRACQELYRPVRLKEADKKDYPATLARFQDEYQEIERRGEGTPAKGVKVLWHETRRLRSFSQRPRRSTRCRPGSSPTSPSAVPTKHRRRRGRTPRRRSSFCRSER
jgi:hypothetical protein